MSVINLNFEHFIRQVEQKGTISEAIERAEKMYCLKSHKISEISSAQALKLYESIYLKFYKSHSQLISTNWYENELRIFIWTLACYTYLHQVSIEDLGDHDWHFFSTMFDHKDPKLFQYQCHAICSGSKSKPWLEEEEKLLKKIVQNRIHNTKWNEVSKLLFHASERKYFRNAKQCRERWNNHLDPSKIKGYWKAEECLLLFNFVKENGKKWASLVKIMKNTRNEHSIKNKFNSILKKHKKLSPCSEETEIFDEIIEKIKKSIASKASNRNGDASFDFDQFSDCDQSQIANHNVDLDCHEVTQSFLKKLLNYRSYTEEEKNGSNFRQGTIKSRVEKEIKVQQPADQVLFKHHSPRVQQQEKAQNPALGRLAFNFQYQFQINRQSTIQNYSYARPFFYPLNTIDRRSGE